jgi:hypothetical protein
MASLCDTARWFWVTLSRGQFPAMTGIAGWRIDGIKDRNSDTLFYLIELRASS